MKNTIFLAAIACLLAGCAGDSRPDFKVTIQGSEKQTPPLKVATEPDSPIRIDIQSDKGLPVKNEALQVSYKMSKADWVAIIIAGLAALFVLLSAIFTWRSARNTRLAAEGSLFSGLMHRYDLEGMHEALKDIWNWGEPYLKSGKLEEEAKKIIGSRNIDKNTSKINQARRRVSHYYLNVLQLKRLRYINKDVTGWIFKEIGADILDVIEPLEKALIGDKNGDNQSKINEEIKQLEKDFNEIRDIAG